MRDVIRLKKQKRTSKGLRKGLDLMEGRPGNEEGGFVKAKGSTGRIYRLD